MSVTSVHNLNTTIISLLLLMVVCGCMMRWSHVSGVVEGERGGRLAVRPNILLEERRCPTYCQDMGNADTVAFPQIGPQRNEKSRK